MAEEEQLIKPVTVYVFPTPIPPYHLANPPPPRPPPQANPPPPPPAFNCCEFLFYLIGSAVFLLFLYVAIPELQPFHFLHFSLDSVTVSPINSSSFSDYQLNANWNVTYSILNTNNNTEIIYDLIYANIFYRRDLISADWLPNFHQPKNNLTTLIAWLSAPCNDVSKPVDVSDQMLSDLRRSGSVNFDFQLQLWARLPFEKIPVLLRWWPWFEAHLTTIVCDDVKITYANPTALGTFFPTPPRQCSVY